MKFDNVRIPNFRTSPVRIASETLEGVHPVKALRFGRHAAIAVIAAGALALTACGSDNATNSPAGTQSAAGTKVTGTLTGIGSSAQGAAMDVWKTNFAAANQGATVQYSPDGSGAGRKAILDGSAQFAGSDAYLKDEELASVQEGLRPRGRHRHPGLHLADRHRVQRAGSH